MSKCCICGDNAYISFTASYWSYAKFSTPETNTISYCYDCFRRIIVQNDIVNPEKFNACDRLIDPLREIMFHIVIADEFAGIENWELVKIHLDRARSWLSYARGLKQLNQKYVDILADKVNKMYSLLENKNVDEWEAEMDLIIPSVIHVVFEAFAECLSNKKYLS